MSNSKFLKNFEHFSSAKLQGFIIPNEYADNIKKTVELTYNALKKGLMKPENLDMIYTLCPDSSLGYNNPNHHGLEVPKEMLKNLLEQYNMHYDNLANSQGLIKQK